MINIAPSLTSHFPIKAGLCVLGLSNLGKINVNKVAENVGNEGGLVFFYDTTKKVLQLGHHLDDGVISR